MTRLQVEPRFCGPPGCAHGGYLSGLLAAHSDQQLRIRLLRPIPLGLSLQLERGADGTLELKQEGVEQEPSVLARCLPDVLDLAVPPPPGYLRALEASLNFIGFTRHAFPDCFACGTQRARGDGLRIFAGPLPGGDRVAAGWVPDASLSDGDGKVRPEFMAAALDCPGYFAARADGVAMLLGEFTTHVDRCVHIDEPCSVIGWKIAASGRKCEVGTALFDEDGELCARARAVWVEPRGGLSATTTADRP
ncbi:MAG TPA: hypothetical protein VHX52_04610 [Steroidobacteraceae bacterium]|nr:hypothetical protein [Steroidobacteraceae bacterium]